MYLSRENGWYAGPDGSEIYVPKGQVRPDDHPDVKALPSIFDQVGDGPAPKAAPAKPAAPAGKVKAGG